MDKAGRVSKMDKAGRVAKMDKAGRIARRRELRNQQAIEVKKSKFITQYIKTKYSVKYAEASEFYNSIIKRYPEKRDLTKTIEFRAWEFETAREAGQLKTESLTPKDMASFELKIPLLKSTKAQINKTTAGPGTPDEVTAGPGTPDEVTAGPGTPDEVTADLDLAGEIEVIGFGQAPYFSMDEIEPGLITQLCEQLQADPDLKRVFEDIEMEGVDFEY